MDKGRVDGAATRALCAIGARFQLGGASPEVGFDCVGLAAWVHGIDGETLPSIRTFGRVRADYWHGALIRAGFRIVRGQKNDARPKKGDPHDGDLLLLDCGRGRLHLGVALASGLIHAHAGLGRVVFAATPAPMRVVALYRKYVWQP